MKRNFISNCELKDGEVVTLNNDGTICLYNGKNKLGIVVSKYNVENSYTIDVSKGNIFK